MGLLPEDDEEIYGAVPVRRRPQISDLLPEEEKQNLLGTLANAGASGLTGLGWILDTPGAMLRGTLGGLAEGDPLRGLRALGQTSDERTDGREMLRQFGLVGDEDNWGNFAGGLAAEVITDPTLLFGPWAMLGKGAASTAGRTLSRSGLLDNVALLAQRQGKGVREFMRTNTAASVIGASDEADAASRWWNAATAKGLDPDAMRTQPLAGMFDFRIPGMESGYNVSGGRVGDMTAKALDTLGARMRTTPGIGPVANRLTAAFDPTVMGEVDPTKQWRNREAFAEATRGERAARQWLTERSEAARGVTYGDLKFDSPEIQNAIRDTIESPTDLLNLQDQKSVAALYAVPEWKQYRDDIAERLQEVRDQASSVGRSLPIANSLEDVGFFPSQAIQFDNPDIPFLPGRADKTAKPYNRGARVLNLDDVVGRGRDPKTDLVRRSETFRRLMSGDTGRNIRSRLTGASPDMQPGIIDDAFTELGMEAPYSKVGVKEITDEGYTADGIRELLKDPTLIKADRDDWQKRLTNLTKQQADAAGAAKLQQDALKSQLAETLLRSDNQFASKNVGLFDRNTVNDMQRYLEGHARSQANSKIVLNELDAAKSVIPAESMPGGGSVNLIQAAKELGYDPAKLKQVLATRRGMPADIDSLSIDQSVLADLKKLAPPSNAGGDSMGTAAWNSYTNLFKVLALANPAYHTRNAYSGYISSLTQGDINPFTHALNTKRGWQIGRGNYDPVFDALENTPGYSGLSKEEIIAKFKREAARNNMGSGLVGEADGISQQAGNVLYPGGDTPDPLSLFGENGLLYDPNRKWSDWLTVRGVNGPMAVARGDDAPLKTLNPLIDLHERASRRVEDGSRIGTYLTALQQGYSPDAAARQVAKTQVDYSPRAFTDFERKLKGYVPFYSYTRGIAPLVADNIINRPGGLQGQSIRAVTRGSEPSEGSFLPEHLRQSAAIPLPAELGGKPAENLQRVLTNIDLPYEGLVNLFSPGTGNTTSQKVVDSLQKTGTNLLGQLNPIVKGPLEWLLNRQLYSGRDLSDTYSVLENAVDPQYGPLARAAEQVLVNAPGGSKAISLARTAMDDRLSPTERAVKLLVNNLAGVKITDIDQERTQRLAARNTLNELLSTTPGVRTYENLTVPEETLRAMEPEQKRLYLLYKVIQAEAAKRAREKKKQQAGLDPLELLGAVNRF